MRTTLCGRQVDETTDEQRASHKLREAPVCGVCASSEFYGTGEPNPLEMVFTKRGARRHYAKALA